MRTISAQRFHVKGDATARKCGEKDKAMDDKLKQAVRWAAGRVHGRPPQDLDRRRRFYREAVLRDPANRNALCQLAQVAREDLSFLHDMGELTDSDVAEEMLAILGETRVPA